MYIYFYVENLIDGKEFVALQENEVKDLIPPLGIVKKILRLAYTCQRQGSLKHVYYVIYLSVNEIIMEL